MTYQEKLLDPRWQRKKSEIQTRENFECKRCGGSDTTLHVHHLFYDKDREPWEYDDNCFELLCKDCHGYEEINKKEFYLALNELLIKGVNYGDLNMFASHLLAPHKSPITERFLAARLACSIDEITDLVIHKNRESTMAFLDAIENDF